MKSTAAVASSLRGILTCAGTDVGGHRWPSHAQGLEGTLLRRRKQAIQEPCLKPRYVWHEDKLPWGDNVTYPAGWDPGQEAHTAMPPLSQAPIHGYGELDTDIIGSIWGRTIRARIVLRMLAHEVRRSWHSSPRWAICIATTSR